jgi:porin
MRAYALVFTGLVLAQGAGAEETCVGCEQHDALTVAAAYTGEQWRAASGGLATGSRYLDNLDITIDADAEQIFGAQGMQMFAYLLYNNGHGFNEELIGAAQGVSNIEASQALRLYELWTQWSFGAGEQSLRVGLYDLNSEFDSIDSAGVFINPSHGVGPDLSQTGQNGPSIFPVTSLGARLMKSRGAWSARVAVLDAVPGDVNHPNRTTVRLSADEGALVIGEADYHSSSARVGVGYWRYTAGFAPLDADVSASDGNGVNDGVYAIVERPLVLDTSAHLDLFLRAGVANGRINPVDRYIGGGAVYTLASKVREQQIGVSIAVAEFGEPYRRLEAAAGNITDARESIVELTYRVAVAEWLNLQPDVQYIRHPGVDPQLSSAWVVGLRFELGTQWGWPR